MKDIRKVFINNESKYVSFDSKRAVSIIHYLDEYLPEQYIAPQGELSIAIFDDRALARIHKDFLNDGSYTDVITFDGDAMDSTAGEICVSAECALKNSKKYDNTPNWELCLYIVHGYLHLAGIDDITENDAKEMRKGESVAIKILEKKFRKEIFKFITL